MREGEEEREREREKERKSERKCDVCISYILLIAVLIFINIWMPN